MRRVALVGPMGAGKSTVGPRLARHLGAEFADLDDIVVGASRRSIADWFARSGEACFRQWESHCLQQLTRTRGAGLVLATGGGIVLCAENRQLLRHQWFTVYLRVRWDVLVLRLEQAREGRPLLASSDWREALQRLLNERDPLYRKVSRVTIDVSDLDVNQTVQQVAEAVVHMDLPHADPTQEDG